MSFTFKLTDIIISYFCFIYMKWSMEGRFQIWCKFLNQVQISNNYHDLKDLCSCLMPLWLSLKIHYNDLLILSSICSTCMCTLLNQRVFHIFNNNVSITRDKRCFYYKFQQNILFHHNFLNLFIWNQLKNQWQKCINYHLFVYVFQYLITFCKRLRD
jgi:hypothetical protein